MESSEEYLGENPPGFLTQRAALEEDQLGRVWVFLTYIASSSAELSGLSLACVSTCSFHIG